MSTVSDTKDLIAIVKLIRPILDKYILCKNTKDKLNSGYQNTIVLNKYQYPFEIEKRYLLQLFIMDVIVLFLQTFLIFKFEINMNAMLYFSILLLEAVLIFEQLNRIYKENLSFLHENEKDIKTPGIVVFVHTSLYTFSSFLFMLSLSNVNQIALLFIFSLCLYIISLSYIFMKKEEIKKKDICKLEFVKYGYIHLKKSMKKIYRINMSVSNILIQENDDLYVHVKPEKKEEKISKIYQTSVELLSESKRIEKEKIEVIEIGRKKIKYLNGMWLIEN